MTLGLATDSPYDTNCSSLMAFLGDNENTLEVGINDEYITLWMYWTPLNCTIKMVNLFNVQWILP